MNKLTSKCNGCPSRRPYLEQIDGTKKYQCVEIVCKRQEGKIMDRQEAIERIKQNKAAAEFYAGMVQNTNAIKNELKDIEAMNMAIEVLQAVQDWIPFTRRPMTEEEQKDYPHCTFMFDCVLPDDGEEILVSSGRFVWMDTFCNDIDGCYLDGGDDIDEDMAWMPLPEPYREDGEKE